MAWSDFLGDIDWGNVITAGINYFTTSDANERAAQSVANANAAAALGMSNAQIEAARLQAQGVERAQKQLEPIIQRTIPAVDYLGRVVADRGITPEQAQRISDVRQQTAARMQPNLGGRAATAIATRAAQDLENSIYNQNRNRSDTAAQALMGTGTAAINASAGAELGLGRDIAQGTRQTAENIAQGTINTGQEMGASALAQGENLNRSLSDIFRQINVANNKKSNYSDFDTGL